MKKYSSFKNMQKLTENFRSFLDEDSGGEESEHDWKNARADREDADELDDEGDKRGADKLRSDADYEEDHVRQEGDDEENLDEVTIIRGLYRTSEAEMEDMLRDMANELHDQDGDVVRAVNAMERNVDRMKYSSARHSGAQARRYHSSQQYMTGREAFRAMMSDFGQMLLDDLDVEDAVKKLMADAKRGKYSLRNPGMRENKNRKGKGKKTSLLEIKRRRSRARRKQNK